MEILESIKNDKELILKEYNQLLQDNLKHSELPVHLLTLQACNEIMPLDRQFAPILKHGYKSSHYLHIFTFLMDLIVECGIKHPAILFTEKGDLEIYNFEKGDYNKCLKMRFDH